MKKVCLLLALLASSSYSHLIGMEPEEKPKGFSWDELCLDEFYEKEWKSFKWDELDEMKQEEEPKGKQKKKKKKKEKQEDFTQFLFNESSDKNPKKVGSDSDSDVSSSSLGLTEQEQIEGVVTAVSSSKSNSFASKRLFLVEGIIKSGMYSDFEKIGIFLGVMRNDNFKDRCVPLRNNLCQKLYQEGLSFQNIFYPGCNCPASPLGKFLRHYYEGGEGNPNSVCVAEEMACQLLASQNEFTAVSDVDGDTPLMWASRKGDRALNLVKLIVEAGVPLDTKNYEGKTALICAAEGIEEEEKEDKRPAGKIVSYLLGKGADVSIKSNNEETILTWAARRGKEFNDIIPSIVAATKSTDDLNALTPVNGSALSILCEKGDEAYEAIESLLNWSTNPNNPDGSGTTPLMQASIVGDKGLGILELLLVYGADVTAIEDDLHFSALECAESSGHSCDRVVKALKNAQNYATQPCTRLVDHARVARALSKSESLSTE